MARLPYLEADQVAPEYRDMLKRNTNLHKLLVNSPEMARAFNGVGGHIRFKSRLDPRLRELAILQVGWMEKSAPTTSRSARSSASPTRISRE
jgi:alkylhydroperoxidase family enzyme